MSLMIHYELNLDCNSKMITEVKWEVQVDDCEQSMTVAMAVNKK